MAERGLVTDREVRFYQATALPNKPVIALGGNPIGWFCQENPHDPSCGYGVKAGMSAHETL
jgi:hypothetical protein